MKVGDILYVTIVEDSGEHGQKKLKTSIVLKAKQDQSCTLHGSHGANGKRRPALVIPQWTATMTRPDCTTPVEISFPPMPQNDANREKWTIESVAKSPFTDQQNAIVWRPIIISSEANLDGDSIPVVRRVTNAADCRVFVAAIEAIVSCYVAVRDVAFKSAVGRNCPKLSSVWHLLLSYPKLHLRTLRGTASTRLRGTHARKQLAGEVLEQVTVVNDSKKTDAVDPDERFCRKAKAMAEQNFVSKAARCLGETAVVATLRDDPGNLSEAAHAKAMEQQLTDDLAKLHPKGTKPTCTMPSAATATTTASDTAAPTTSAVFEPMQNAVLINIPPVELVKMLRSAMTGSAPGGSGWTEEMLYDACVGSERTALVMCTMLADLACGRIPEDIRERINTCDLLGLPKPDGGTRPIALSEVLLKIATRFVLLAESKNLKRKFDGIQFGVSYPGGAEFIVHTVRDHHRTNGPGSCTVTIDCSNAFNAPERQAMWDAVRDFPYLRALFWTEYGEHSKLRIRGTKGGVIESQRGSRQGTTAGPAFFCLALHPALVEANKIDGVSVLAYMDDMTINASTKTAAHKAWTIIREAAAKINLHFNAKKCEVISRSTEEPLLFLEPAVPRVKCSKVLGAMIAFDNDTERAHVVAKLADKFSLWFRRIKKCCGPYASAILAASQSRR